MAAHTSEDQTRMPPQNRTAKTTSPSPSGDEPVAEDAVTAVGGNDEGGQGEQPSQPSQGQAPAPAPPESLPPAASTPSPSGVDDADAVEMTVGDWIANGLGYETHVVAGAFHGVPHDQRVPAGEVKRRVDEWLNAPIQED